MLFCEASGAQKLCTVIQERTDAAAARLSLSPQLFRISP